MNHKTSKLFLFFLYYGFFTFHFSLLSCLSRKEQPNPPSVLAMVNGEPIKEDALRFRMEIERLESENRSFKNKKEFDSLKKKILRQIIENKIIIDWGKKKEIYLSEKEQAYGMQDYKSGYTEREFETMLEEREIPFIKWQELAKEKLLVRKIVKETLYDKIEVSNIAVTNYYRDHAQEFEVEESVKIRHIVTDTLEKAKNLREQILKGESFAKLAIMHSLSPDRSNGGELDYFQRGSHPKEFDEICFELEPGEMSPVVKSPYGFHIFKLIDKMPRRKKSIDEVRHIIEAEIRKINMTEKYGSWLNQIEQEAQILIVDDALDKMRP